MISKAWMSAALLAALLMPAATTGQTGTVAGQPAAAAAARSDCATGPCDYQPPRITLATPAPAASPWPLQDRILWGAQVLLAILGYVGILAALALLRKVARQTRAAEETAQAAADSAQAALLQAQALTRAERPWLLVTVEPSRTAENAFAVVATNRGRSPARIESIVEGTAIVADEEQLPAEPVYEPEDPAARAAGLILLPGESARIRLFHREDVKEFCGSEEKLKLVEEWKEKIFLFGRVRYSDLVGRDRESRHETTWCCWYIHGRQKSGMAMAGPAEYHWHS